MIIYRQTRRCANRNSQG